MITVKTEKPLLIPLGVWESEVRVNDLTPTRRDKMVALLNLSGFNLRISDSPDIDEITESTDGKYIIGVE